MKIKLPILCAMLAIWFCAQSCHKSSNIKGPVVKHVFVVGGLLSFTGNWSSLGITTRASMYLAVTNINNYLAGKNADFRLATNFQDTHLDPATATTDFEQVIKLGENFVIGPQSSAELAAILPKADSSNVIVISQGSTAGTLAFAGDPVFRFCPPDKVEGAAIAKTIYKSGIKGLVTLARNDDGNIGLQSAVGNSFTSQGGQVSALQAYSTTITDFTTEVSLLRSQVDQLANTYGSANVGVYLASFDECVGLFKAAASDPVLSKIHWFGGDGVVLSTTLTSNAAASDFAIATNFFAPTFGLPPSLQSQWKPIADNIKASTGIEPDAFALAAYDAMWVIERTIESVGDKNITFEQLETAFAAQANAYSGITGSTALDVNGDRVAGDYDYYGIQKNGTTYAWTVVGESE